MKIIRADLHMHGPIGFQPYWLRKQGYAGKNLLQLIADECFQKGITITAITSQADEIPLGRVHDRFGCLVKEAALLPRRYITELLGSNVLIVEKENQRAYVVNGQTVMPCEDGKRFDMLVVGSNQVPNGMNFRDTLQHCGDKGLTTEAEHPLVEGHRGMGQERLEKYLDKFDAIEGFNAQTIFPGWSTKIPLLGKKFFSRAGRELNERTKEIARRYGKSFTANSDAHRIEHLGISHISWVGKINDESEDEFLRDLKGRIRSGNFRTVEKYLGITEWLKWVYTSQKGIRNPENSEASYIPSNGF